MATLKERVEEFEAVADSKLMRKLPVIVELNGRSFKKTTSMLSKPYDALFAETMCAVMIKLASEIDGTTFVYAANDEIILVSRNDQTNETGAWCNNKAQKMVSIAASVATCEFNRVAKLNDMQLLGDAIFAAKAFVVPNIVESINVLIHKQQKAYHNALSMATFYELLKKHTPDTVRQILYDKSTQEKEEILLDECDKHFDSYDTAFRRGCACYRVPKIVDTDVGQEIRNKLIVDTNLPVFTRDTEFLGSIFRQGRDIFRANRDDAHNTI